MPAEDNSRLLDWLVGIDTTALVAIVATAFRALWIGITNKAEIRDMKERLASLESLPVDMATVKANGQNTLKSVRSMERAYLRWQKKDLESRGIIFDPADFEPSRHDED